MMTGCPHLPSSLYPTLRPTTSLPPPAGPANLEEDGRGGARGRAEKLEKKEPAGGRARRIKAGDRHEIAVDALSAIRIDAQPAEGEAHAAADLIGLERRLGDGVGPVRLV